MTNIARFGLTKQKINNCIKDIEELKSLRNNAIGEKGQTQEATSKRNAKMIELKDYCYELKALEGQPQLLEMLGIVVRS